MSEIISVYALVDPRNEEVRYIGLTNAPEIRLGAHIRSKHGIERTGWIAELKSQGLEPRMVILEETDRVNSTTIEHQWYMHYLNKGARLTNAASTSTEVASFTNRGSKNSFSFSLTAKRKRLLILLIHLLNETEGVPKSKWNGDTNLTTLLERALEIAVDALNEGFVNSSSPDKLGG